MGEFLSNAFCAIIIVAGIAFAVILFEPDMSKKCYYEYIDLQGEKGIIEQNNKMVDNCYYNYRSGLFCSYREDDKIQVSSYKKVCE